jgi:uncharacterized protein YoxC
MEDITHCFDCDSHSTEHVCKCEDSLKFYCTICFEKHKLNSHSQDASNTSIAQSLISDPTSSTLPPLVPLTTDLQSFSQTLHEFKESILETRDKLIQNLYSRAEKAIAKVDKILADIENKSMLIQTHVKRQLDLVDALLKRYQEEGLQGILNIPHHISINYKPASKAIKQLFQITNREINERDIEHYSKEIESLKQALSNKENELSDLHQKYFHQIVLNKTLKKNVKNLETSSTHNQSARSSVRYLSDGIFKFLQKGDQGGLLNRAYHFQNQSTKRYIYFPVDNSQSLMQYDISTLLATCYDLSKAISTKFNLTSVCILFNGDIFIAGGWNENRYLSDCYIYRVAFRDCIKLADMQIPRSSPGLVYHKNSVYSFGGYNKATLKSAERYEIYEDTWRSLPEMKSSRINPACISYKNRIFILGGGSQTAEIFRISNGEYTEISWRISCDEIVGAIKDKNIYIVSDKRIYVLDTKLNVVDKLNNSKKNAICVGSNIVMDEEGISFYNKSIMNCEKVYLNNIRSELVLI